MMASYDGHATKRQRTDVEGHGVQSGKRDRFDDPHKPSPSAVVHVRGLSDAVIEQDIVDAVQQFGAVSYCIMMPKRRQALIEFEDINGAKNCVNFSQANPIYVGSQAAFFNFSTSQKIQRPGGPDDVSTANHILLFTVLNPQYPVNVDILHTVCSPSGQVQRIVIFNKNGVQAMVEFDSIDSAKRAKQSLNGADIYSGCCTLKIEYAKPTRLNVFRNDSYSHDYTNPTLGDQEKENPAAPPREHKPLLANPTYGGAPTRFAEYGRDCGLPPQRAPAYSMMETDTYDSYGGRGGYSSGYGQQSLNGQERFGADRYGAAPPDRYGPPAARGGGYEQPDQGGAVLMVYGLGTEMNCDKLFNLFCLYGNVIRVKFLKSKEGSAMIQLGDPGACDRAIQNMNNVFFYGNKIQLGHSKQAFLKDVQNPNMLADNTPSFKDFMGCRNNRFSNPDAASKNRIHPPTKVLHYFNAPPTISDEELKELFIEAGAKAPEQVKKFPSKTERSSSGLMEWDSESDALEALVSVNHAEVPNPDGKRPYVMKLCFSSTPIDGSSRRN